MADHLFHFVRVSCLLLLSWSSLQAQDQFQYYGDLEKRMREHYDKKEYQKAHQLATELLNVFPDNFEANVLQGASLMFLNKPAEARKYVDITLELDPSAPGPLTAKAYLLVVENKTEEAKKIILDAIRFGPEGSDNREAAEEMSAFGKIFNRVAEFNALSNWLIQTEPTIKERWPSTQRLLDLLNQQPQDAALISKETIRIAENFKTINRIDLSLLAYFYGAKHLDNNGFPSEANELSLKGYRQLKLTGLEKYPAVSSQMLWQLIRFSNSKSDFEQVAQYASDFPAYFGKALLPVYDTEALQLVSTSYSLMRSGNAQENSQRSQEYAVQAFNLAKKYQYLSGIVSGCNAITMTGYGLEDPQTLANAIYFGEQGYLLADQHHLDLKDNIITNLALLYWRQGPEGKQKCLTLYRNQIDKAKRQNEQDRASLLLNNLGSMYYATGDIDQAIGYFEESAALAGFGPDYKNASDRLSHYQSQMTAYQWLVACYAKTGNTEKTFEAMERSRARVLTERLSQEEKPAPIIADLQDLLKPDEACILYDVFSGYETTILVVTKKYAHVLFHVDDRFVGDIRDKYFAKNSTSASADLGETSNNRWFEVVSSRFQRTQVYRGYDRNEVAPRDQYDRIASLSRKNLESPGRNDAFLFDVLNRYQKHLIVPILNKLNGIKTLIISPSDNLSFIPFEALKMFDGKFLVEKYNIRYLHSTSVWQQLQSRQYDASRQPLLAMGGAIYEQMDQETMPLASASDLNLLQAEVAENIREGKSLRMAYASLFGTKPLTPLPGTVEEVKNIAKNISGATVFTGADMSESRIKQMSSSGELKKYKMLHLATHGFVVSEIPDLSGIAMSISPKEQNGEDGFLNTVEMANLNVNADLMVLSACQTALGKLYVGEGVTGLTQSLLLAGSNAALVSLWPVNDTSTMKFMSDFYKEIAKGKPYWLVVSELKRKFIKGDYGKELQHPYFWAPFIYYGK